MGRVECRRGAELPAAPCGGIYGRRPLHRDTKLPCLAALQPGELRMSRRSWGRNRCRPPSCLSMPVRSCLCARCQEVDARRQNCLLLWHACRLEHGSMWSAEISGYFSCQGMFGRTHSFWVQMITCYAVCKIAGLNACAISQQWAAVAEIGGCRYYLTHHSLYLTLPDTPSSIQEGLTPNRAASALCLCAKIIPRYSFATHATTTSPFKKQQQQHTSQDCLQPDQFTFLLS